MCNKYKISQKCDIIKLIPCAENCLSRCF